MQSIKKNAIIIGGGIHGITIALELSEYYQITILDDNEDILMGSSYGTHNRIHLGYHYPRSIETIEECKLGYDFFIKGYKDCLIFPDFYYMIEKNSYISSENYVRVMESMNLPCLESFPDDKFLDRNYVESSFKVGEACFDLDKFRSKFKQKLIESNVKIINNFHLNHVEKRDSKLEIFSSDGTIIEFDSDLIINCTYTFSNNILEKFGIDNFTEYEFEQTEIAVVECEESIPAMTMMDGPFISILPYGSQKNKYIVYDVENSVMLRNTGFIFNKVDLSSKSNWKNILEHGLKYYPIFSKLKYCYSIYSHRPIPINIENDSRVTRVIKENYEIDFYSIREGKFISAPLIAEKLKNILINCGE